MVVISVDVIRIACEKRRVGNTANESAAQGKMVEQPKESALVAKQRRGLARAQGVGGHSYYLVGESVGRRGGMQVRRDSTRVDPDCQVIERGTFVLRVSEIEKVVQEELDRLKREPPAPRELQRALNQYEADLYRALERVGRKADLLNAYSVESGRPDFVNEDLARHRAVGVQDIQSVAWRQLPDGARAVVSVVPEGKTSLAAAAPAAKGGAK